MKWPLIGGPYDGVVIDHHDVNLYTKFWPVGIRKFIFLPPLNQWESVKRGELDKEGQFEGSSPCYELVRTADGMEGRFDPDGRTFLAAGEEYRQGEQPIPYVPFTGQYYKCFRGNLSAVNVPNTFKVVDEKDREWLCVAVSREEGETGKGTFDGVTDMAGLRISMLLCESLDHLRIRLSDNLGQ